MKDGNINRIIIDAYAMEQAGFGAKEKLEIYLCTTLGLPIGYLEREYKNIVSGIYEKYSNLTNEQFKEHIYKEYVNLINSLKED